MESSVGTVGWIYLLKESIQGHPVGKIYYKIGAVRTTSLSNLGERFVRELQIGNPVQLELLKTFEVENSMDLLKALSDVCTGLQQRDIMQKEGDAMWFTRKHENTTDENIKIAIDNILSDAATAQAQSGGGRGARHEPGFIYLIKEGMQRDGKLYYKIGAATDVVTRLMNLQTGNPIPLLEVAKFKVEDMALAENAARLGVQHIMCNVTGGGTEWLVRNSENTREDYIIKIIEQSVKGQ